ncbi:hypothetical protein ACOSP7_007324 [Xanthoceras sorbifolium]
MGVTYWRYSDDIRFFGYLADVQCVGLQSSRHKNTPFHHLLNLLNGSSCSRQSHSKCTSTNTSDNAFQWNHLLQLTCNAPDFSVNPPSKLVS